MKKYKIKKDMFILASIEAGSSEKEVFVVLTDIEKVWDDEKFTVYNISKNIKETYYYGWFINFPNDWEIIS